MPGISKRHDIKPHSPILRPLKTPPPTPNPTPHSSVTLTSHFLSTPKFILNSMTRFKSTYMCSRRASISLGSQFHMSKVGCFRYWIVSPDRMYCRILEIKIRAWKAGGCDVTNLPYMAINWQSISIYGDVVTSLTAYYSCAEINSLNLNWIIHFLMFLTNLVLLHHNILNLPSIFKFLKRNFEVISK